MKIVLVTPFVYPFEVGGAQVHTYYLAKIFARKNHVVVISRGKRNRNERIDTIDFVLVKTLNKFLFAHALGLVISLFRYFQELSKHQSKVIIIDFLTSGISELSVLLFSVLRRVPYIVTIHGHEIERTNLVTKFFQRVILSFAKHIIVVNDELLTLLIKSYQIPSKKITIINNGYDYEEIERIKVRAKKHEETSKRIVYVGRLSLEKDPLTLIRAVKIVLHEGINVKLFVVGGGPLLPDLRKFCIENRLTHEVILIGQVDHRLALEYMVNSDMVILSSIEEGLPTAIIEAMALGKPVVATNVGGLPELIDNGKNGILVSPKSPEQLAAAISEVVNNVSLSELFSSNSYDKVKSLTWDKVGEKYDRILRDLVPAKNKFNEEVDS